MRAMPFAERASVFVLLVDGPELVCFLRLCSRIGGIRGEIWRKWKKPRSKPETSKP